MQQPDKDLMDLSLRDLRTASCRVLREPKPHECQAYSAAESINTVTFGIVSASLALIGLTKLF